MQGKGKSLRLGLLALVVVLIFGTLGSFSLAADAFDDDYNDCPARTRLDGVNGLTIDRTDEKDEIRVSWEALNSAVLGSLGPNAYKARLTVIVDDGDGIDETHVALGDTNRVFDHIDFTKALTVSIAVTQGSYVISDIAEKDFTSGMPAPTFKNRIRVSGNTGGDERDEGPAPTAPGGTVLKDKGSFYYLGFNDLFDNWFVSAQSATELENRIHTKPSTSKFRVGLIHGAEGLDLDEANFANYRITIEDGSGDLLGYQAETVSASRTYSGKLIVFGAVTALLSEGDEETDVAVTTNDLSSIRLSNRVDDGPVSPYYTRVGFANPAGANSGQSYANIFAPAVGAVGNDTFPALDVLYVEPPVEYFDFPSDIFEDDGNYTIKAWAEDDDGTRISPQASIVLSAHVGEPVGADPGSIYNGYGPQGSEADGRIPAILTRGWETEQIGLELTVYGLTVHDE